MLTAIQVTEQTRDFIEYLEDRCYAVEDMYDFINEHGEDNFRKFYEAYVELGENYTYPAVDAFVAEFGIDDMEKYFEDAYCGNYATFLEFAEEHFDTFYADQVPDALLYYFDKFKYADDLKMDHTFALGYVFRNF